MFKIPNFVLFKYIHTITRVTSVSEDGSAPTGLYPGVMGMEAGEVRPNMLTIGHQEAPMDLLHSGQTAITIHFSTGNHGANLEDGELGKVQASGPAAVESVKAYLNRCVMELSGLRSEKQGATGTEGADICKTVKYSCLVGVTCVRSIMESMLEEVAEVVRNVFLTEGRNTADKTGLYFTILEEADVSAMGKISFFVEHDTAVPDPGTKHNTSCQPRENGPCAIAAFVYMMVEEASVTNLDGAPSLNGLGDFVMSMDTYWEAVVPTGKAFTPGTRSGYQTTLYVSGVKIPKSKPGYCGVNYLAKDPKIGKTSTMLQNYGPVADLDIALDNAETMSTNSNDNIAEGTVYRMSFAPSA